MIRTFILISLFLTLISAKHIGPRYDTRPREALDFFAQEFARKQNLKFLNTGVGSLIDSNQAIWALNFMSRQSLTFEETRDLANNLASQLLEIVHREPMFKRYCEISASEHRSSDVQDEYVGFRIAFWDQKTNRPLYPYIAQVKLVENKLYYFYANPETQALEEPIVEDLNLSPHREL